ncbi:MAG TPA: NfeD family protein [Candidatus Limnocylindrales bacterium]|nr:NfeD family protein [Candidatus Limnocylindrales bacterium]
MFEIPVEDLVFVVCTLVGGGLLLLSVLLDDILGGVFDAVGINFDIGGVSLMPLLLAFVSMFGVGGLFATQVLDVHGGAAAVVGVGFGAAGFGVAWALFTVMRRSEGATPFSTSSLVGRDAFVAVAIPAGRFGSVMVKAEGQTHEFSATASIDIPAGTTVRVTGTAGTGLIVAKIEEPATAPAPVDAGSEGGNTRG